MRRVTVDVAENFGKQFGDAFATTDNNLWIRWLLTTRPNSGHFSGDRNFSVMLEKKVKPDFKKRAIYAMLVPNQEWWPESWGAHEYGFSSEHNFHSNKIEEVLPSLDSTLSDFAVTIVRSLLRIIPRTDFSDKISQLFRYGVYATLLATNNQHMDALCASIKRAILEVLKKDALNAFGLFCYFITSPVSLQLKISLDSFMRDVVSKKTKRGVKFNVSRHDKREFDLYERYVVEVDSSQFNGSSRENKTYRFENSLYRTQIEFILTFPEEVRSRIFEKFNMYASLIDSLGGAEDRELAIRLICELVKNNKLKYSQWFHNDLQRRCEEMLNILISSGPASEYEAVTEKMQEWVTKGKKLIVESGRQERIQARKKAKEIGEVNRLSMLR